MRMAIDIEMQGFPFTAACVGGLNFSIDMTGELMIGENSSCSMEIPIIGNMDMDYGVTGDVEEQGDVDGTIGLNLAGFFDIPVDWEGELDEHDFEASFDGEVNFFIGQFPMEGSLDATRISPYVDPSLSE
jgi:hypothetical protein